MYVHRHMLYASDYFVNLDPLRLEVLANDECIAKTIVLNVRGRKSKAYLRDKAVSSDKTAFNH